MESLLSEYPNVLVLRVRMPIVGDLLYPRNFITKIIKYEKASSLLNMMLCHGCVYLKSLAASQGPFQCPWPVLTTVCRNSPNLRSHELMAVMQVVNIPNSMTVLPELLPYSIEMVRHLPVQSCFLHLPSCTCQCCGHLHRHLPGADRAEPWGEACLSLLVVRKPLSSSGLRCCRPGGA